MRLHDTDSRLKNFIVLEGIDGSGTSTQMKALEDSMSKQRIPHLITAEPTSRPEGLLIRRILKGELDADPGTVAYLFAADRHQHLHGRDGILEALDSGKIVISDRYALSSLAYQGSTCGNELPSYLNAHFPPPGLTVFFRIDPERSLKRLSSRASLEIYEKMHMQKLVSLAYEAIVEEKRAQGWNIEILDAEQSVTDVTEKLFHLIEAHTGLALAR